LSPIVCPRILFWKIVGQLHAGREYALELLAVVHRFRSCRTSFRG
jgi:hypothetical protein